MLDLMLAVLDHAPVMTAGEKLVLVAIAEECRAYDRPRDIDSKRLLRRTGLSKSGLRKAIGSLKKERGIDVRVPLGIDSRGAPLYAVPGSVTKYVLRESFLSAPIGCDCKACGETSKKEGGTPVPPSNVGGTTVSAAGTTVSAAGTTVPAAGTTVPPKTYVSTEGRETYVAADAADAAPSASPTPSAEELTGKALFDAQRAALKLQRTGKPDAPLSKFPKKNAPTTVPASTYRPCLRCGNELDPAAGKTTHPGCDREAVSAA